MLTRIEIDGFKTFENFSLDLRPLTAIVGPNASGKSNLFDALKFVSLLAQLDIRTAMQDLRGEPEELFRKTSSSSANAFSFAVEVLLGPQGVDAFGTTYRIPAQRLRYELKLGILRGTDNNPRGVFVREERCFPISKKQDRAIFLDKSTINYNSNVSPFIRLNNDRSSIEVKQDGRQKHGRPMSFSLKEATRTALSTITTAEFPHLYALREILATMRFLEINPRAARAANDRFEERTLKPDASNLAAVLAHLKEETSSNLRPDGILPDIAADLASLIPSVQRLDVKNDQRQFSFNLEFADQLIFCSRVISDGTLRLLALLTLLNDPSRRGTLCFEEPENGVHEGRVPMLVEFLRSAAQISNDPKIPSFQILINTHSPKVMKALANAEIVFADSLVTIDPSDKSRSTRTRMRTKIDENSDLFDPSKSLTQKPTHARVS